MTNLAHIKGRTVEKKAEYFLRRQGLISVACNYRTRTGEIDLIMRDRDTLVFIEVRYRENNAYGTALNSIDQRKQNRIITAAQAYLGENNYTNAVRFDVITYDGDMTAPTNWIRNAFTA